jgi:hypothetical protein
LCEASLLEKVVNLFEDATPLLLLFEVAIFVFYSLALFCIAGPLKKKFFFKKLRAKAKNKNASFASKEVGNFYSYISSCYLSEERSACDPSS